MLTAKRLFLGETVTDTLAAVIEREPDLARVPPKVRKLLKSCLEKDPRKRLRDIGDVWRQLEETPLAPVSAHAWKTAPLAAAGLLAAALAALAFVHFREEPPEPPKPVRFQLAPPSLASGPSFYLALSPDGSKLAYTAVGPDGANHLWVRAMDTLEARLLAGTDGALSPFWSPDSRFIGFGVGTRLKKVDATGATPPLTLCESPNNVGIGTWSTEGVIVFGGRGSGPLRRVADSGGTPAEATVLGANEGFHTYPVFLPDQRHFVYLRSGPGGVRGIYAGSLDAKPSEQPSKRILETGFGVTYVPPLDSGHGRLLFLRESALMAQPFDEGRLELTGEPAPVAENVASAGSGGYFTASAGALVYRSGGGAGRRLTWFDRKGTVLGTAGAEASYDEVALSPDGSRAAVFQDDGQFDIWLLEFARGATSRFTFSGGSQRNQVWSPDGSQIVFTSGVLTSPELQRKASNGAGEAEILFRSPEQKAPQDWSRDGQFLLYMVLMPKTGLDLWVLADPSGERKPVPFLETPFNEYQAQFSPDGRWISYTSNESGAGEIYVRPFAPSGSSAAGGGKWMISNGSGFQARWRRDGKELLYLSSAGGMMSVDVNTSGGTFQASVPKPLFDVPIYGGAAATTVTGRWDMTADAQKFLVTTIAPQAVSAPITVLLNWQGGLKK
jgi:Tol biopolymer transport system component